jgi:hypothetical protein
MFPRLTLVGAIFSVLTLCGASAQELAPLSDLPQQDMSTQPVLDEPIRQIADTSGGCAVLDKDFPGLRQHSMYPFFKSMSLNQIAAMSKGQITSDMLAQAKADLTMLGSAKSQTAAATPVVATSAP